MNLNKLLGFSFFSILGILLSSTFVDAMSTAVTKPSYKISTKLFVDGRLIAHPIVSVVDNKKVLMVIPNTKDHFYKKVEMSVVARGDTNFTENDTIKINYDISYSGSEDIIIKPKIIVRPNQVAKIKFSDCRHHTYKLAVLVEK